MFLARFANLCYYPYKQKFVESKKIYQNLGLLALAHTK